MCGSGVQAVRLPHLSLLNLDGTRVTPGVVHPLQDQCPALTSVSVKNLHSPPGSDDEHDM